MKRTSSQKKYLIAVSMLAVVLGQRVEAYNFIGGGCSDSPALNSPDACRVGSDLTSNVTTGDGAGAVFFTGAYTLTGSAGSSTKSLANVTTSTGSEAITGNIYTTTLSIADTGMLTAGGSGTVNSLGTVTYTAAGGLTINGDTNSASGGIAFGSKAGTLTINSSKSLTANVTGSDLGAGTLSFVSGGSLHGHAGSSGLKLNIVQTASTGDADIFGDLYTNTLTVGGSGAVYVGDTGATTNNIGTITFANTGAVRLGFENVANTVGAINFGSYDGSVTVATKANNIIGSLSTSGVRGMGIGTLTFMDGGTVTGAAGNASNAGSHLAAINVSHTDTIFGGHIGTDNLSLGTSTLTMTGFDAVADLYSATINVTAADADTYGKMVLSGAYTVNVNSTSTIAMTTTGYIPTGTRLTLVSGIMDSTIGTVGTITSDKSGLVFTQDTSDGENLVLVASRPSQSGLSQAFTSSVPANSDLSQSIQHLDTLSGQNATTAQNQLTGSTVTQPTIMAIKTTKILGLVAAVTAEAAESMGLGSSNASGSSLGVSSGDLASLRAFHLDDARMWAKGFGTFARQEDRDGVAGYQNNVLGTTIGVDALYDPKVRLGFAGSYVSTNVKIADAVSGTNANTYQGTFYGVKRLASPFYVDGNASFAWNHYHSTRGIVYSGVNRAAQSKYNGQQYAGQVGGGMLKHYYGWNVTPNASIQYNKVHLEPYTEANAGDLSLEVDAQNYDALIGNMGIRFSKEHHWRKIVAKPEFKMNYMRDFIAAPSNTTASFTGGGASFSTKGLRPYRSTIGLGASLKLQMRQDWSLLTDYSWEVKKQYNAQQVMLTGKVQF